MTMPSDRLPARPVTGQGAQLLRLPGDRLVVAGTLAEVGGVLDRLRAAGRLLHATDPQPHGPGQVMVTVRVFADVMPANGHRGKSQGPSHRFVIVAVMAAVILLGAVGIALWVALSWVANHLAAIIGLGILLAIAGGVAGRRGCEVIVNVTHRPR